jgi:hypothetical protein
LGSDEVLEDVWKKRDAQPKDAVHYLEHRLFNHAGHFSGRWSRSFPDKSAPESARRVVVRGRHRSANLPSPAGKLQQVRGGACDRLDWFGASTKNPGTSSPTSP